MVTFLEESLYGGNVRGEDWNRDLLGKEACGPLHRVLRVGDRVFCSLVPVVGPLECDNLGPRDL